MIVPIVVLWLQYGESETLTNIYKIGMSGLLVAVFIFLMVRKIWLKPEMDKWSAKIVNLETTSYSISNDEAMGKARNEWKLLSILTLAINTIVPVLLFALSLMVIKAVEQQVMRLYGVLSFCGASLLCGIVVKVVEICTSKFKGERIE